jgi:hypothetical protein
MNRRQALQAFLNSALQAAGAVVLASSAVQAAPQEQTSAPTEGDVEKRARKVAEGEQPGEGEEFVSFRNGVFLNLPFLNVGGLFGNGRFGNGFLNRPFGNGRFGNGGFRNDFRNSR